MRIFLKKIGFFIFISAMILAIIGLIIFFTQILIVEGNTKEIKK
jgi:hypothetical protein